MSETLNQHIATLQDELNTYLNREDSNLTQDQIDRRNWLSNQLAEAHEDLKSHQKVEQNHEVRIQQTQEQITYLLDSLEADGISIRNLCISETAYELLRASAESAVMNLIQPLNENIKGSDEREQQLQRQNDRLQETIRQREATIQGISEELNKTKFELEDSNQKRDAAVRATEQVEESLRLKQEELDLERAEKALGAREAYKVVDTSEQIKQLAENFRKSQIKVTNIRWEDDLKKTFKLAELAENGETIRFHYFEQGKYLELNPQEVLQFRLEQQANSVLPNLPLGESIEVDPPALEVVTQDQFRTGSGDVEGAAEGATDVTRAEGQSMGSTDDQAVHLAEFEALKSTVARLAIDVETLKRREGLVA